MTYLGCDHHKGFTQIAAVDERGDILHEAKLPNSKAAFELFLKELPGPFKGVVEAGTSSGWLYDVLSSLGVEMIVAHPRKVRAIADAKVKTDKIDARMLAQLLRGDLIPEVYVPSEAIRSQKMLWRERIGIVRTTVRLKNRIHWLLARYQVVVPEFSDLFGPGGRKFLESLELPQNGKSVLKSQLRLLDCYAQEAAELQRLAIAASKGHPYRGYLESMPGFGKIFAPLVALEIDRIERFPSPEKFASYCGLAPSIRSSSDTRWLGEVGRECNHWLKWAFVEGAWAAIRTSPYFRLTYQRLRQRKKAQVAIVACARRMSQIAYLLLTQKRLYEERPIAMYV